MIQGQNSHVLAMAAVGLGTLTRNSLVASSILLEQVYALADM